MTEAPKKKMSKRCIIGLVALGVALIIAVGSFMYLPGMLRDKMKAGFAELETKIVSLNPPGYTTEEIHSMFSTAMMSLDSGWVSEDVIKKSLQSLVLAYSNDTLTQDDAVKALEALRMLDPNAKDMGGMPDSSMMEMDTAMGSMDMDSTVGGSGDGGN